MCTGLQDILIINAILGFFNFAITKVSYCLIIKTNLRRPNNTHYREEYRSRQPCSRQPYSNEALIETLAHKHNPVILLISKLITSHLTGKLILIIVVHTKLSVIFHCTLSKGVTHIGLDVLFVYSLSVVLVFVTDHHVKLVLWDSEYNQLVTRQQYSPRPYNQQQTIQMKTTNTIIKCTRCTVQNGCIMLIVTFQCSYNDVIPYLVTLAPSNSSKFIY